MTSRRGTYLRRPGDRTPRGRVVLNDESTLAVGLVGCWPMFMDGRLDIIEDIGPNKLHATWAGTPVVSPSDAGGYMATLSGDDRATVAWNQAFSFANDNQLSIMARQRRSGSGYAIFGQPHASTHTSPWFRYCLYSANTFATPSFAGVFRINTTEAIGTGVTAGVWLTMLGVYDGANMYLDYDGKQNTSTAKTGSVGDTNSRPLHFFENTAGGERMVGDAFDFRLWKRALTPTERVAVYDPATRWDIYYELGLIVYSFPAPAATDTSVTPNGPAAITLTGFAPTPTVAASVAPGVGAISLTGHAPGLMISPQPGTGQLALTGLPPTPTVAASVAPGVGALSLTGHAPGLRLGAEPGTGAIVVTGHAPTVEDYGAPVDSGTPSRNPMLASVGRMMNR